MNKLLLILLALCLTTGIRAQEEITVKTFRELTSDLSARTARRYDLNDDACALIKVQYPKPGATFEGTIVGESEFKSGEYWVYVSKGTKRIKVHLPEVPIITVEFSEFGIDKVESNVTYCIDFKFPSSGFKATFYAEAGMVVGSLMGPEISVGTYLGGFNIELNAMLPLSKSDNIYWNKNAQTNAVCTYKTQFAVGGRIGYGIMVGEKLRITPQVGVRFLKTGETMSSGTGEIASGAYCNSLVIAVKAQYMVSKNFSVSLSPEYDAQIMKSEGFKALADVSSKIKGWNNGIGVKLAAGIEF